MDKGIVQCRVIGCIVLRDAHCRVKLHTDNKIYGCTYCKSPRGICPRPFVPLVSATVLWRRYSLRNRLWTFCSVNRLRWAKLILNYIVYFFFYYLIFYLVYLILISIPIYFFCRCTREGTETQIKKISHLTKIYKLIEKNKENQLTNCFFLVIFTASPENKSCLGADAVKSPKTIIWG